MRTPNIYRDKCLHNPPQTNIKRSPHLLFLIAITGGSRFTAAPGPRNHQEDAQRFGIVGGNLVLAELVANGHRGTA